MNIKMNDFVRNILQNKFYAFILLSDTRPKTPMHSYLRRCFATVMAPGPLHARKID